MRLYRRGDVWHYDFTVAGERCRGSTGFSRKADAQDKAEQLHRQRSLGQVRPVATLREVARQWFTSRQEGKKSVATVAGRVKVALRLVGPETPVNQIGPREIEAAMMARRFEPTRHGRAPSNSTINRDLIDTTLRPILHYAAEVMEEPVKPIPWRKLRLAEPKGRTRSFTPEELKPWLEQLPEWHRPLLRFILRYGVRLQEAFFPLAALNVEACEVTVRNRKNGLPHIITLLPEDARDLAARAGRARAAKLDTVWFREMRTHFVTSRGEDGELQRMRELRPIQPRGFQSASYVALRQAQIADARPVHDGRHHAATTLLRLTGRLELVKELLGHEAITSTMRYAHTDRADLHKAMRHAYGTGEEKGRESTGEDKGLERKRLGT